MKKIIILGLCFVELTAFAQDIKDTEVPAIVKEAFAKKHPGLKPEWEKEGVNYEAEYEGKRISVNMENGRSMKQRIEGSILFGPDGTILESEEEIPVNTLPVSVADHVSKNMPGKKIKEASRSTDKEGTIIYEVEIGKEEFQFNSKGEFIGKSPEKEDDKDK